MTNLKAIDISQTSGTHRALFDQINGAFGTVPNMFRTIGQSEAALESMWTSFGALGKGALGAQLGEEIAVLVANINRCEYCLAAHTVLGQNAGASAEEMSEAQAGRSGDAGTQAALDFAGKLVRNHGKVSGAEVDALRHAGYSDQDIAEILAHVALNIFTNYTNVAFDVPVDFPKVPLI